MNPLFIGGAFMGGAASLVAATVAHRHEPARFRLLAAASAAYVLGVVGVTMAGNVPLNEKLAEISVATASGAEVAAAGVTSRGHGMDSTSSAPAPRWGRWCSCASPCGPARDLAGDKDVVVASSKIAQQCLASPLLKEFHVDLVPVLLGEGVPRFENLPKAPVCASATPP